MLIASELSYISFIDSILCPADAWIHGYFSDTALTGIWDTGYLGCLVFGILDTTVLRYPDFGYCIRILYRSGAAAQDAVAGQRGTGRNHKSRYKS